ncbi:MAG TPA: Spy/CpxP family protein refolding chaperone [Ignavibacteria bacterium]|nr:Spy/CpxP family protein refolding chaperone [Ignavibacteria bacterium]
MSDMSTFNNPPEASELNIKRSGRGRKRKIIIGAVLVMFIITGVAGFGFARGFYDKHRGDGPWGFMIGKIAGELDLNDQQKAEVEKIRDEIKAKMESNKPDRNNDMAEMEQMFRSDSFDKQKALDLMKQNDAKRDEMRSFMLDEVAKFHSILTPEQRS